MIARRYRKLAAVVAVLALLVLACAYGVARFGKTETFDIEVIIKTTDDKIEFWQVMKDGIGVAANEFGANVRVTGSRTEADVDEQIATVEAAIRRKPDAIVLAATDSTRLVPVAEKVRQSGIKLFIVDSGIHSDIPQSIVATDNYKAGREAGAEMLGELRGPGKVALINFVRTSASLLDRESGARGGLTGRPDIQVLDSFDSEGSEEHAYAYAKRLIAEEPDLVGIVGMNEPTTVGAGRAIRDTGSAGRVKLIGFDSSMNEIKLLEEGIMQATIIQKPFQMGYLSIKTAVDALRDRKVPKMIDTGSLVITKRNMYDEENQKLLFPFYDK